jgi:membrane protein required for colicin V production
MAKRAHQSTEIGSFDRAAGLAFGVLRGVLVVALLVLLVRRSDEGSPQGVDPTQESIRSARTYPIYNSVASVLEVVLPRAGQRARDMINGEKGESAPIPPAEPAPQAPSSP